MRSSHFLALLRASAAAPARAVESCQISGHPEYVVAEGRSDSDKACRK